MRTYLRILSFARPLGFDAFRYSLWILLATVFSVVNIALVVPILEVLFDEVAAPSTTPEFEFSIRYFRSLFYSELHGMIQSSGKINALYFVCGLVLTSVLLANLFRYLSQLIVARVRVRIIQNLRQRAFEQVTRLDLGYFTNRRKGDIVSRLTNDMQEVEQTVVSSLRSLVREPLLIAGYFVGLFMISSELTLYSLLVIPIAGFAISVVARKLKKRAHKTQEVLGRINTTLDESLGSMRVVKAFGAAGFVHGKFASEVHAYARQTYRLAVRSNLAAPISEFIGVAVIALILLLGGRMVLAESATLSASAFIGFLLLYAQMLPPARALSTAFSNVQRGIAAGDRIFQLMDEQPTIQDREEAQTIVDFREGISFQNVNFRYEQTSVLKAISFEIPKGKVVALVGPSGAGKSTIADLLPRFYDPASGNILLDGLPLSSYRIGDLRGLIGMVPQEPLLFNGSISENIAFGRVASMTAIQEAAKTATAHAFIQKLEHGYNSSVGERGLKLSGGERQRISIARAVLGNPPILILDEATSSLDAATELQVQEALRAAMKNRTTLVIAHRLKTVQYADWIVVLDKGEVSEQGTHADLMQTSGLYHQLVTMQNFWA